MRELGRCLVADPRNLESNPLPERSIWGSNPESRHFIEDPVEYARNLIGEFEEIAWPIEGFTHATPERSVVADAAPTVFQALYPDVERSKLSEPNRAYLGVRSVDVVLADRYDEYTQAQSGTNKLTRETFGWLKGHTESVLSNVAALEAFRAMMVGSVKVLKTDVAINDIGKFGPYQVIVKQFPGVPDTIDHDVLMVHGLKHDAELSPSFARQPPEYREVMLEGLASGFNLAQFMQAENRPASLLGLEGISEPARQLHYLHGFYDLSGAAGDKVQRGSVTATESTVRNYRNAIIALEGVGKGKTVQEATSEYLACKASEFGIDTDLKDKTDLAVTRLATAMRMWTPDETEQLYDRFVHMPKNTRIIHENEAPRTGVDDGIATIIYYAPAILLNLQSKAKTPEDWQINMATGLTTLARLYQHGRARDFIRHYDGNGVQTIHCADIAADAATDPGKLNRSEISFTGNGLDVVANLDPVIPLDTSSYPRLESLGELEGDRPIFIGLGGGSDGTRAANYYRRFQETGKNPLGVISIRSGKPQSQSADGSVPSARTVTNPELVLADGVYKIGPESSGSGRFLENLPAADVPMYLVVDDTESSLTGRLQTAIDHMGNPDAIYELDSGGDGLFAFHTQTSYVHEKAISSPDQDERSMRAAQALPGDVPKFGLMVAPVIDGPLDTAEILHDTGAMYYEPGPEQTEATLADDRRWGMDGTKGFGKTADAIQQGLAMEHPSGVITLNTPEAVVLDPKNPWIPYVVAQQALRGVFIVPLDDLQF